MLNHDRILKIVTAIVYVAAIVVMYMDVYIWRP